MPKERQMFKEGSSFEAAKALYDFDQHLRSLAFDEIAKIEVAVRSALANVVSNETGNAFWITDASSFAQKERYLNTKAVIAKELQQTKEEFINHFRSKYSNPYPPAWMLVEILPLGVINNIYGNLADNKLRKKIASEFYLPAPVFRSWLTTVTLTRNACCHHARIWNKENSITPVEPKRTQLPWLSCPVKTKRVFYNLCIIKWFANVVNPDNGMSRRLNDLFISYPIVDISAMGFPLNWRQEPLWQV